MTYDVDDHIAIIDEKTIKQAFFFFILIIRRGILNLLYVTGGNCLMKVRKYEISTPSIFILFYVIIT